MLRKTSEEIFWRHRLSLPPATRIRNLVAIPPVLKSELSSQIMNRETVRRETNVLVQHTTRSSRFEVPGAETAEAGVFARAPEAWGVVALVTEARARSD
jgi:hypothetical protein